MNLIDGCGRPVSSRHRHRIVDTGNRMAQRCWERFKFSRDERHAQMAEWWREQIEKALDRSVQ